MGLGVDIGKLPTWAAILIAVLVFLGPIAAAIIYTNPDVLDGFIPDESDEETSSPSTSTIDRSLDTDASGWRIFQPGPNNTERVTSPLTVNGPNDSVPNALKAHITLQLNKDDDDKDLSLSTGNQVSFRLTGITGRVYWPTTPNLSPNYINICALALSLREALCQGLPKTPDEWHSFELDLADTPVPNAHNVVFSDFDFFAFYFQVEVPFNDPNAVSQATLYLDDIVVSYLEAPE